MTPAPDEEWAGPVRDSFEGHRVAESRLLATGRVWSVRRDVVEMPAGGTVERDLVVHPGAVAILALDDTDRVLLIRQYRHPVGMYLFETPAGLLDVAGEDPLETARRELVEEAGIEAGRWDVLLDFCNSPGGTSEALRCYLARDLSPVPGGRISTGEAEEHHLPRAWVPLDEARDLALSGALHNVTAVLGILAAYAGRASGWAGLRPGDAQWPIREHLAAGGRLPGTPPGPAHEGEERH